MSLSNILQDNNFALKCASLTASQSLETPQKVYARALEQTNNVGANWIFDRNSPDDNEAIIFQNQPEGLHKSVSVYVGQNSAAAPIKMTSAYFTNGNPHTGTISVNGQVISDSMGNFTGAHRGTLRKEDEAYVKKGMVVGISKASVDEERLERCEFEFKIADAGDVPFGVFSKIDETDGKAVVFGLGEGGIRVAQEGSSPPKAGDYLEVSGKHSGYAVTAKEQILGKSTVAKVLAGVSFSKSKSDGDITYTIAPVQYLCG